MSARRDKRAVACNMLVSTSVAVEGARAYVVRLNPGWGHDRIVVLVRSRGGRWVERWEPVTRLTNFRAVTIPPDHPRYDDQRISWFLADEAAVTLALIAELPRLTGPS